MKVTGSRRDYYDQIEKWGKMFQCNRLEGGLGQSSNGPNTQLYRIVLSVSAIHTFEFIVGKAEKAASLGLSTSANKS